MPICGIPIEAVENMGPNILTIERLIDFLNGLIKFDRRTMHAILLGRHDRITKTLAKKAFNNPKMESICLADILTIMFGNEPTTGRPWISFQVDDDGKLVRVGITRPEDFGEVIRQRQNAIDAEEDDD